jgi:hypothetical protein
MHSLNHLSVARVDAAERVRRASRAERPVARHRPPPLRGRAAYAAARLARRLDSESARRAVA